MLAHNHHQVGPSTQSLQEDMLQAQTREANRQQFLTQTLESDVIAKNLKEIITEFDNLYREFKKLEKKMGWENTVASNLKERYQNNNNRLEYSKGYIKKQTLFANNDNVAQHLLDFEREAAEASKATIYPSYIQQHFNTEMNLVRTRESNYMKEQERPSDVDELALICTGLVAMPPIGMWLGFSIALAFNPATAIFAWVPTAIVLITVALAALIYQGNKYLTKRFSDRRVEEAEKGLDKQYASFPEHHLSILFFRAAKAKKQCDDAVKPNNNIAFNS